MECLSKEACKTGADRVLPWTGIVCNCLFVDYKLQGVSLAGMLTSTTPRCAHHARDARPACTSACGYADVLPN
jgi:hypothetical protein